MASSTGKNRPGSATLVTTVQDGHTLANVNPNDLGRSVGPGQSCAIVISNHHTQLELSSPKRYLYSGVCVLPPAPVIRSGFREVCFYKKQFGSLIYGTAGLLSFDIIHDPEAKEKGFTKNYVTKSDNDVTKLFLMWSVPAGFGTTYHSVGILKNKAPSHHLFSTMYHQSHDWFHRDVAANSLDFSATANDIPIRVIGSMSTGGNAIWKIEIC